MHIIFQGESLLIPASVAGDKTMITGLTAAIKASKRGEVPKESDPVVSLLSVEDYVSAEVGDGYLFSLIDTTVLTPGIYYVNHEFVSAGYTVKGEPYKVVVKESVV